MELALFILIGVVTAATPLVLAALGELVAEKAGALNLGVEGMMAIGAIAGFAGAQAAGHPLPGLVAAVLAGAGLAIVFGGLTQGLGANQVAAGLALTIFGLGLSALAGQAYSGQSSGPFPRLSLDFLVPGASSAPAEIDPLALFAILLVLVVRWFLGNTRAGLVLRAVGENHDAAHAIGYPVVRYRLYALAFGGACAGLGGAYLSLVQTPFWVEKMTAGRGWIALALVVFAAWRPLRLLAGAYLFGGITILQLHGQAIGLRFDAQVLSMLPYLATIVVLVLISRKSAAGRLDAPASLGKPFHAAR